MTRTVSTVLVVALVAAIISDVTGNRHLFGRDDGGQSVPKAGEPSRPASVGLKQSEPRPGKQGTSPLSETDVFTMNSEGYPKFRIPAVIATTKGTLLAFCEGRTGGDSGDIDLVCKRSTDGGKTWGDLQVVWNDGKNTCGNPTPVVDRDTGTVWLFMTWNLGSDDEKAIMEGKSKDVRHVYVTSSVDDGKTWAVPEKLNDVRQEKWRWYSWPEDKDMGGKSRLLFCSPAGKTRDHLTVWISHDEGKSWPPWKEIHQGGSGYSSLVVLTNRDIGVFFEKDGSKSLTFTTVSLAWLEEKGVESEPKDP